MNDNRSRPNTLPKGGAMSVTGITTFRDCPEIRTHESRPIMLRAQSRVTPLHKRGCRRRETRFGADVRQAASWPTSSNAVVSQFSDNAQGNTGLQMQLIR